MIRKEIFEILTGKETNVNVMHDRICTLIADRLEGRKIEIAKFDELNQHINKIERDNIKYISGVFNDLLSQTIQELRGED